MNLDLGILWIEDSFSTQEEAALRRRVQDAGFIARIESIPNGTGIEDFARRHRLFHLYDIILLDFRLKDENGDDLAPKLRALFPSTTILFYSGSVIENELRIKIASKSVEGVYCSARNRFIDRAGELIDQTARSLDRLSGMRGLAMRVVAECDDLMKAAIISMTSRDAGCAAKIADLDADVLKSLDTFKKKYQDSCEGDLTSRLATRAIDSAKIFKHFRTLTKVAINAPDKFNLDNEQIERLRELRSGSAQYIELVLGKRNIGAR